MYTRAANQVVRRAQETITIKMSVSRERVCPGKNDSQSNGIEFEANGCIDTQPYCGNHERTKRKHNRIVTRKRTKQSAERSHGRYACATKQECREYTIRLLHLRTNTTERYGRTRRYEKAPVSLNLRNINYNFLYINRLKSIFTSFLTFTDLSIPRPTSVNEFSSFTGNDTHP